MKALRAVVVGALLNACGGSRVIPADTLYDDGNQGAADCPVASTYSGQAGVPGDPCEVAARDCSPVCCGCPGGADSFWASECHNGYCLDDQDACNDAPSATYCIPPTTIYDDGDQNAPLCPIPATYTGQPGMPGDVCTDAAHDCSPACCQCTSATDSFWASECANGVCASDQTACNDAPSATLCN